MLTITNPATGDTVETLQTTPLAQVESVVTTARIAQKRFAQSPFESRHAIVSRFRELLQAEREPLSAELTAQMGKPLEQARGEIAACDERIAFFLDEAQAACAAEAWSQPSPGTTGEVLRFEPLGVVANVSAWNYPFFVGLNVIIPALLTGNSIVYKPSEITPLTGRALARLLREAGLPDGVFSTLIGGGDLGAALVKAPVDGVFFTGSHATGKRIGEAAGPLRHVQLELGGKDPAYVCADADPIGAAEALADGAFFNAGQSCCAVERIYVHESVADAFEARFVEVVGAFKVGDPTDARTFVGPLARDAQRAVLEAQVEDATAQGASLELGGQRREGTGYYFEPTVLTRVNHRMQVMREESFGPIIGIKRVASDDEAIALMNDTRYGLTASVFSSEQSHAESLLAKVNAGTAYWNCCDRVSPRLPWTGRKDSGIGATLGRLGIKAFLRPKAYHLRTP